MKANSHNSLFSRAIAALIIAVTFMGCERDLEELNPVAYSTDPYVFMDGFSGGLNYAAFGGSNILAFQVDNEVTYNNTEASMRIEVPDVNDPTGAYAGGTYFTSVGRDLTGYTALTFWAKASQPANIDVIGFGNDLGESKYQVTLNGLDVNTNWKKYYIPIPDPSRLTAERGMFFYSEGPEDGNGYTFWIDEVQFEDLSTIAHANPAILLGQDQTITSFAGITAQIGGLSATFNLPSGIDQAQSIAPAYFTFSSSNEEIATVSATGLVSVVGGPGEAVITAKMGNVEADGSMTVNSEGVFDAAPVPTDPEANVISIFSDAYDNYPVEYYNGYWAPFQTTLSADFEVNGDHILNYTNFNFVGIQFSQPTLDATDLTHLRMDLYFPNAIAPGTIFRVQLVDFGADGAYNGGDDSSHNLTINSAGIVSQQWISLDLPLSLFVNLTNRDHLAQIIFEGVNVSNFYVDNIYFRQ
ncbi:MAG: glycosyl hydrolase family 16 [Flavobacteriales bacterium]|jgi:hypothetical protein